MNKFWMILVVFGCKTIYGLENKICIVPSIPFGKAVQVDGPVLKVGQDYADFDSVKVQCDLGYAIILVRDTDNMVKCDFDQGWDKVFPTCQKICKSSDLIDFSSFASKCTINDTSIPCGENFKIGTKVLVQCKPRYELKHEFGIPNLITCRSDGKWNYSTYKCVPICGIQTPKAQQFIVKGQEANITEAPWNVAIYQTSGYGKELICGGTILTERIVISAAHCFNVESENGVTLAPISSFQIVAGKFYRDFLKDEIFKTQTFGVAKIETNSAYRGLFGSNHGDISIVVLNGLIKYELHIAPICMKYSGQKNIVTGSKGWVFGWGNTETGGSPSDTLKSIEVPYVRWRTCRRQSKPEFLPFITNDKICLGYSDGSGVCRGDSGAGMVFPEAYDGKTAFYLRGIVSIGPKNIGGCDLGFYTLYTNVHKYIPMIQNATARYPSTYEEIAKTDVKCQIVEMVGHTIETTCSMNDEDVPCPDKVMPGVVAKTKCKLGYKAADSKSTVKSKCMDDGTWERAAVVCLPKCGIFKKQFVVAGANKTNSVMPWHVLIYRQGLYVCGGTIITDRLVLSAKSCFYEFYNEFPVNEFSVLVGRTKFDLTKSELGTQSFAIEKTHKYLGYYEGDIILMTLDKRIQFNDHIMPICIDLKSSKEAPVGQTGKISAPTGACNGNEFLDTFDLKALDKNDYQEEARKLFISPEKFGGGPKGSDVCSGNIGSGYVFPKTIGGSTAYYLIGVVSIEASKSNIYFTNVIVYSTFLEDTIEMQIQKREVYDCPRNEVVGHNIITTCTINDDDVPCPDKILPNTVAKTKCKLGFKTLLAKTTYRSKCMEDGNWDRAAASCLPKCGLIKENKNGIQVPWNVAIYKNELFICGGTIISEKVVISTAHCFHRETSTKPQLEDISQFKIVAGKYHRDLNATDPLPTQTIQINSIRVIDGYSGAQGKYNGNMVFLILQKKIEFKDHITPICMDFDPKLGTHPLNDLGKIAGWSFTTPGGNLTDELKMFEMPVVSYLDCINIADFDNSIITPDKYCAGQPNKLGACNADSGVAFAFPKEVGGVTAYYLRGIVSNVNFRQNGCESFLFTVFTNAHIYLGTIESILNEFK